MFELAFSIIGAVLIIYAAILIVALLAGAFMNAIDAIGQKADEPQPPTYYSDNMVFDEDFRLVERDDEPW